MEQEFDGNGGVDTSARRELIDRPHRFFFHLLDWKIELFRYWIASAFMIQPISLELFFVHQKRNSTLSSTKNDSRSDLPVE